MNRKDRGEVSSDSDVLCMELNEENVDALYAKCLEVYHPNMKLKEKIVSPDKAEEHFYEIQYLFGQTLYAHDTDAKKYPLLSGGLKYDQTRWTNDYHKLNQLYDMVLSCKKKKILSPFKADAKDPQQIYAQKGKYCIPTKSPKDPEFADWYSKVYLRQR